MMHQYVEARTDTHSLFESFCRGWDDAADLKQCDPSAEPTGVQYKAYLKGWTSKRKEHIRTLDDPDKIIN